jgi:hypothetical protein
MRWLKKDRWKAGIAIAGLLLLLVLIVWTPVSAAGAYEEASVTRVVQVTPTEDATVTALNKEKLAQEVQQLRNQNEPDPLGWLRTNAAVLFSTLAVVFGGLFGLWRWLLDRRDAQDKELGDRKTERDKRDEEQRHWLEDQKAERERREEESFQSVVEGLGSTSKAAQVGAAIMLRRFLRPGYEQFYSQAFDLAVAYLRLRGSEPEPPDSLNQALIRVFRESFPLARDLSKQSSQSLDALGIRLDGAYLARSDLRDARLPESYLRKANLWHADLSWANLRDANLSDANLSGAILWGTDLSGANLWGADLSGAYLGGANLRGAIIDEVPTTNSPQSTFAPPPASAKQRRTSPICSTRSRE